jgi:hypothetical protein
MATQSSVAGHGVATPDRDQVMIQILELALLVVLLVNYKGAAGLSSICYPHRNLI